MSHILILVVVYRTELSQSSTLKALAVAQFGTFSPLVFVWDNGPFAADAQNLNWLDRAIPNSVYHYDESNSGLAAIYNKIIDRYIKSSTERYDYLVLLDHDSDLPVNFFLEAQRSIAEYPDVPLYLPLVTSQNLIVSPADLVGFRGKFWDTAVSGLTFARNRTAINSGMMIAAGYLRDIFPGYDERLRFYNTDNFFMRQYQKTQDSFVVLDIVMPHDLSQHSEKDPESRLLRHRENMRSLKLLYETSWVTSVLAHAFCWLYNLRTAIKHRDIRFLA